MEKAPTNFTPKKMHSDFTRNENQNKAFDKLSEVTRLLNSLKEEGQVFASVEDLQRLMSHDSNAGFQVKESYIVSIV